MARIALTDELWEQLQHTMKQHGCYITKNTRTVMEAILWKLRTGAPWRDIPEELISWKTAYNRFNRWSENGLWENFFFSLRKEIDTEWVFIDGSYIRCHQHASGARLGFDRAIGQSHGGRTTKIHLCCDPHCQNSCHPHPNNLNGGKGDNHGTIQSRTQTSNIKQTAIA